MGLYSPGVFSVVFALGIANPVAGQEDALRQFFKDNNRLLLVNPFPQSVPLGSIVRPQDREMLPVDRKCFAAYQEDLGKPEAYEFVDRTIAKRRNISTALLQHLPSISVGDAEKVSISVLEGKHAVMDEGTFKRILDNADFPDTCRDLVTNHKNHYIVYEVVTGRLSMTFWHKVKGEWRGGNVPMITKIRAVQGEESSGKLGADEPPAVWESTSEGGIQMKEPRVLAVHARHWSSPQGEFSKPMSYFQFSHLYNLDWKLVESRSPDATGGQCH